MSARRAALLALAASTALAAAGCSGGAATGAPAAGDAGPAGGAPVVLFAPASLTDLAPQLAQAYAEETGDATRIVVNLGSSAQLVQQANAGEVPDVLITADVPALDALEQPGDFTRLEDVALNSIVLAVPADSDLTGAGELSDADTVALCAPSVPCGRAANRFLQDAGIAPPRVSEEDNVRAVLSKVASGQVDAGFVYATDAAAAAGAVRAIPLEGTTPNAYPLLVAADAPASAGAFGRWLLGDTAGALFEQAGFTAP